MKHGFAKKSLGQHFLVDEVAIQKIAQKVPENTPLLLEIGPGRGAITSALAERADTFCLLEKDDDLFITIQTQLRAGGKENFHAFLDDALEFDWTRLWTDTNTPEKTPLVIAANLPYNVATEIFFRLYDFYEKIPLMILMFQKEVGLRFAADVDTSAYGSISVVAQNIYDIKVQQILKPGSFRPPPKVDSAILTFERRKPDVDVSDLQIRKHFSLLVRAAFGHRRKTVENSLTMELGQLSWSNAKDKKSVAAALAAAEIDGKRRAETITLKEYAHLFSILKNER